MHACMHACTPACAHPCVCLHSDTRQKARAGPEVAWEGSQAAVHLLQPGGGSPPPRRDDRRAAAGAALPGAAEVPRHACDTVPCPPGPQEEQEAAAEAEAAGGDGAGVAPVCGPASVRGSGFLPICPRGC